MDKENPVKSISMAPDLIMSSSSEPSSLKLNLVVFSASEPVPVQFRHPRSNGIDLFPGNLNVEFKAENPRSAVWVLSGGGSDAVGTGRVVVGVCIRLVELVDSSVDPY